MILIKIIVFIGKMKNLGVENSMRKGKHFDG